MNNQPEQLLNIYLTREQAVEALALNGFELFAPKGARVLGVLLEKDIPTTTSVAWYKHWSKNMKQATTREGLSEMVIAASAVHAFMAKHADASYRPATLRMNLDNSLIR